MNVCVWGGLWNAGVLGSRWGGELGATPPEVRSPTGQKGSCKNVAEGLCKELFLIWHLES